MPISPTVTGIVLAAGESRRLGRPKQLLAYQGRPLLQHVVDSAAASNLTDVIVVVGAYEQQIRNAVDLSTVTVVQNPSFVEGQGTSIRAALAAISREPDAVLFLLGDQPGVTVDVIDAVAAAFDGAPDTIVMPSWQGTPANPVLFGQAYFEDLQSLTGDEGARQIVKRHHERVRLVPIDRPVPQDVDTDDDYRRLLETSS